MKLFDFSTWVRTEEWRFLQGTPTSFQPDVVVAADGTGDYATVAEAVEATPLESNKKFVIYVKKGLYKENIEIKKKQWNVVLIGDGMENLSKHERVAITCHNDFLFCPVLTWQ